MLAFLILFLAFMLAPLFLALNNTIKTATDYATNGPLALPQSFTIDALVIAGVVRFRPIIMTTMAMIFGMMPLALSLHEGSSQNAPMAHAVIGGLVSSTVLTLVVVPVALTYVESFGSFVRRFLPKAPDRAARQPAE